MMWDPMLKGFAGAVVGGMTSLPGAVFGAYMIGIIEHLFAGYVSIEFKSVVAFAIDRFGAVFQTQWFVCQALRKESVGVNHHQLERSGL